MSGAEPDGDEAAPVSHLPTSWNEAVRAPAELERVIERWMPTRRWFAAKDLTLRGVSVDDVVVLAGDTALLVVRAEFAEGDDHRYAVPLLLSSGESPREITARAPSAVVVATTDDGVVVDAMSVEDGARCVVGAALRRHRFLGRRAVAAGDPRRTDVAHLLEDDVDVRILSAEQSNTSVILGGEVIGKLVRRLSAGESPDITLPQHLRAAGFEHVPDVVGTLDVDDAGQVFNVVVVHDAIEHEADLWQTSQDLLQRILVDHPTDATAADQEQLERIAHLLGRRTAEMHLALAGGAPAFEPEPLDLAWQQALLRELEASMTQTQHALARARSAGPDGADAWSDAVLERLARVPSRFDALSTRPLDGARIRVHGDLHLGQVLWTGDDVVIIDFEGEPGRPIEQRTVKQSPLADVAGMVRSFDYAGRVALSDPPPGAADGDRLERRRAELTSALQDTYWNVYRTTVRNGPTVAADRPGPLIPSGDDDALLLLDAQLLLKALYEVRYELANRPGWVSWPLSAVAQLLGISSSAAG